MSDEAQTPEQRAQALSILSTAGRVVTRTTGLYSIAMGAALPVGIISAIVVTHYLTPTQFGQLGLLMVLASFLTVVYNIGLLHGTFLWVYGNSGDAAMDLEIEGLGRANMAGQRRGMGTGMILTLIVAGSGTALCFMFAKPLASLLLGNPRDAKLVGLAAISGGSGSLFRLTLNVFRLERRPVSFMIMSIARPVGVLVVSTALIVAGKGVYGAVLGTALPTLACAIICVALSRRSYALAFSFEDARAIGWRSANVLVPVIALWIAHNGDIYLLSHWVHVSGSLGIYRLASRLGTPPSYFASAFLMAWSPLEGTALLSAAFKAKGRGHVRSLVLMYYILVGLAIVVFFTLFSHLCLLVAPKSYADAAKVVPLIALAFVSYGAYIITLRTARPDPHLLWYAGTAVFSTMVFVGSATVLIPAFGIYGAPSAMALGMTSGCVAVLIGNSSKRFNRLPADERLPVPYHRLAATIGVSGAAAAVGLVAVNAPRVQAALLITFVLIAYPVALVLSGAVPRSQVPLLWTILRGRRRPTLHISEAQLSVAERETLVRFRDGELHLSTKAVDYARLIRALRRLGGIGRTSSADVRIGVYLASPEPESIRDYQLDELLEAGVNGYELHQLDGLARIVRRRPATAEPHSPHSRGAVRAAVLALEPGELDQLAHALANVGPRRTSTPPRLALVRAARLLRPLAGLGRAGARDLVLARALWCGERADLTAVERRDLRRLKLADRQVRRAVGEAGLQVGAAQVFSNIAIPPERPRNDTPSSAAVSSTARRTPYSPDSLAR
jgi:O-antigen/teichoic acid export membrane protein